MPDNRQNLSTLVRTSERPALGKELAIDRYMKAAYTKYGPPDVVEVEDLEQPVPGDGDVLIKVRAASVNPLDWKTMKGGPYIVRLLFGQRKPRIKRLGVDAAGTVEAVGKNVSKFKPGDDVFGACRGAFAEYACISGARSILKAVLVAKPANVTFEQAAAAPIAGLTALQGLRDKGKIQPAQKVLINGASGGVGTFAVQIAKSFGAEVTGVCSTRNVELVRSLGADRVIDYTREDFTEDAERYDLLFDAVGNRSLAGCRRVLKPKGILVMAGAPRDASVASLLGGLLAAILLSVFVSHKLVPFIAKVNQDDLNILSDLMATGKVVPVIDRRYRLNDVPEALRYSEGGHARGKVVITMEGGGPDTDRSR
jgi:NADPH:quinone reductase-like Zn-dependent oxidoreductase